MIKKLLTILLVLLLVSLNVVGVFADEENRYNVVLFDGQMKYTSIYNGETVIDSSFGKDAAFLYELNDLAYFKIAGDIGYIDIDEVEIKEIDEKTSVSSYSVKDGILYHNIKTNFDYNFFAYSLPLDVAPSYLMDNQTYFSYDGKYFYSSFTKMIDDYRSLTFENAINYEEPYYNYYQYLPVRSYTNINIDDLNYYFSEILRIKDKLDSYSDLSKDGANDVVNRSQIYGELESFIAYEEIYGTNAIRLLADAIHESSYGKSYNSYMFNNLYTNAAFDSDKERETQRYNNIDTSIYSHAKYFLSRAYANNKYDYYKGSHLGDKLSGITSYLNNDPYSGEKVASNYFLIDHSFNFKDKDYYSLGIIEHLDNLNFYTSKELDEIKFTLNNINDYSLILLEEGEDYFKVQIDPSFNSDYTYDPEESIAYIDQDVIKYFVGSNKIKEDSYKEVNYDFGEGNLHNLDTLSFKLREDKTPVMVSPCLEGYDSDGYSFNHETDLYTPNYKKINKIEVLSKAKEKNEYGKPFNIKNGVIKVVYDDYKTKLVNYNTNIAEVVEDNKFKINYAGLNSEQYINLSYDLMSSKDEIETVIDDNIKSYKENGTYNIDELKRVKDKIKELNYSLSFDEIRTLDEIFLNDSREYVNYSFEMFDHDISVSGLALAMREPGILKIFKPFKDTYFVRLGSVSSTNENATNSLANAYGFKEVLPLKLSIQFNLRTALLETPIIVSVKIDDKKDYSTYTVYHIDEDGDITKCLTSQSDDYIQFITKENGDYFIYQKDGFNDYAFDNYYENINFYNADADNHLLFINGSILFAIGILGAAIIVVHIILNKKQEKIWRDYKKSWQPVASLQEEKPKN